MSIIAAGNTINTGLTYSADQTGNLAITAVNALTLQTGSNTATLPAATGTVMVSGNMPTFAAYNNVASFSVSNSTNTILPADTKEWDTLGAFNNTASTATLNGLSVPAYSFMPNIPGYYQFNFQVWCPNSSGGPLVSKLMKNGSQYRVGSIFLMSGTTNYISAGSGIVYMNGTTDYVNVNIYQGSGSTQNCNNASVSYNYINGVLIRSA